MKFPKVAAQGGKARVDWKTSDKTGPLEEPCRTLAWAFLYLGRLSSRRRGFSHVLLDLSTGGRSGGGHVGVRCTLRVLGARAVSLRTLRTRLGKEGIIFFGTNKNQLLPGDMLSEPQTNLQRWKKEKQQQLDLKTKSPFLFLAKILFELIKLLIK